MDDLATAVALLRSPDAAGLLRAALTGHADAALPGFTATLTGWHYRPSAEVTAGYEARYPDGAGGEVVDHLFATTADVAAPAGVVAPDGRRFAVWRHPADPLLPGLAPACDPGTVLGWLGVAPQRFDLSLRGYRPLRRAVLRADADGATSFVKVLRPDRAEHLASRQRLFAEAGLTPAWSARPAPGVIVTPAASGRPLAEALADPGQGDLPTAAALADLLDRLPSGLAELPRRPAWADRVGFHAATAVDRLPAEADRVRELAGRLQAVLDAAPVGPVVATHGDFYEANLLVAGDRLALIDLDASGPGLREDDLACLLAHLAVLPRLSPGHYPAVPQVLAEWTAGFAARVRHPAALFARIAAVVLSLVAGGDDEQALARLDLADAWTQRAQEALGRVVKPAGAGIVAGRSEEWT